MKFTILIVPALLMLTACSEFQYYSSTGFAPVTSKGYGTNYWLAEAHATRSMSPEQRQVTLKLWEQEYNNNPDTSNGLKLALLLTAGDESMRNPEHALEIIEWIDPDLENDGDRELVIILRQFIDEQLGIYLEPSTIHIIAGTNGYSRQMPRLCLIARVWGWLSFKYEY